MKAVSRSACLLFVLVAMLVVAANSYADHVHYYVLDGFGGVHAGGGAGIITPAPPYFGFDIAKDIAYVPFAATGFGAGDSVIVLDGFGGVHAAGPLVAGGAIAPGTPYFGFNIARAIAYKNIPPRSANGAATSTIDISSTAGGFQVIASTVMSAPDDGFLLVIGTTFLSCLTASNDLSAHVTINVDATTEPAALSNMGRATWDDCASGGGIQATSNQTVTHLFPVTAGEHTVNFLGRKTGGTGTARFLGRSITAIFVDQGSIGFSQPEVGEDTANAARAIR